MPSTTGPVPPHSTTAPAAPNTLPCEPEVTATAVPSDPSQTAFSTSLAPCCAAAPPSSLPSQPKMLLDNGWGVLPSFAGEDVFMPPIPRRAGGESRSRGGCRGRVHYY